MIVLLTTDWFDGIAKVIVALGSLGGVIAAVAAWREARNSRIAAAQAVVQAAATAAALEVAATERARVAEETRLALAAQADKLATVATADKLDEVHQQNDGKLTQLLKELEAYKAEVIRLQTTPGATTPYAQTASPEHPIVLSAGEPRAEKKPL